MTGDEARALEPSLAPVFRHAVWWPDAASVSNPLAVTQAYAARFTALGGVMLTGDARTLHRASRLAGRDRRRPGRFEQGGGRARALGADLLEPLGIDLPLEVKRGYHRHFRPRGNAGLTRPVVDAEVGYCVAPMEQGLPPHNRRGIRRPRLPPTPVQFDRLMPQARALFPFGEQVEAQPWMGSRPCFADSMPVIGRAPGQSGLWLASVTRIGA